MKAASGLSIFFDTSGGSMFPWYTKAIDSMAAQAGGDSGAFLKKYRDTIALYSMIYMTGKTVSAMSYSGEQTNTLQMIMP